MRWRTLIAPSTRSRGPWRARCRGGRPSGSCWAPWRARAGPALARGARAATGQPVGQPLVCHSANTGEVLCGQAGDGTFVYCLSHSECCTRGHTNLACCCPDFTVCCSNIDPTFGSICCQNSMQCCKDNHHNDGCCPDGTVCFAFGFRPNPCCRPQGVCNGGTPFATCCPDGQTCVSLDGRPANCCPDERACGGRLGPNTVCCKPKELCTGGTTCCPQNQVCWGKDAQGKPKPTDCCRERRGLPERVLLSHRLGLPGSLGQSQSLLPARHSV